ncbi:Na+/H+ antiporter [Chitinophaga vietnamensis]|uniref:Na+/H+ antiporter n=1 Tax=Chitinophaga vietnamensis TaxID=2593957 RepID=UPI001EFFDC6B|nr:Na+/H+ antiporter [Chitinophaga vietnamensis]
MPVMKTFRPVGAEPLLTATHTRIKPFNQLLMHETLLLVLSLITGVAFLVILAQRLRISTPIFLVLGGLAASFVPGVPSIRINPDLVFLILLPPILFEAAWFTSWKEFWRWRRIILMLAFGFVLITSSAVALVSHWMIPGITLSLGFLLGAIISPPDAVAATSVLKGVRIPKRIISVLEGESLVNDAASLIIFRFALAAVLDNSFAWQQATLSFFYVSIAGIAVGLLFGLLFFAIFRWVPMSSNISIVLSFVAPYLMYLSAEQIHSSGVMAVVAGGMFLSYHNHKFFSNTARLHGTAVWSAVIFVLNGLVFLMIGLELPVVMEGLKEYSVTQALGYALVITAVVILVRLLSSMATTAFTWVAGHFIYVEDRRPGFRTSLIASWAGMRGVVSLASALAIPLLTKSGEAFPHRNLILFITFVVILITLVVQGFSLPALVKWLNVEDPDHRKSPSLQRIELHVDLLSQAVAALEQKYPDELEHNPILRNKLLHLKNEIEQLQGDEPLTNLSSGPAAAYLRIAKEMIHLQRERLNVLRKDINYDDEVIRQHEVRIDMDEERLQDILGASEEH